MNVAEFCRCHGVSTWFFWDLRRRYAREGDAVLEPKSRAPHHPAGRTPLEVEEAIVRKRKELDDAGWDCGPASIATALDGLAGLPHESTIWRILTARGLIVADPSKAPKHTGRSFTAERANECWALDDWTWPLADGTPVQILDVLDDHSRYAVACTAMPSCTGAAAFDVIAAAASYLGWPQRFWSDNARAFTGTLAHALSAARRGRQPHPALQPRQQRQGRTLPPDRAPLAHQAARRRHHHRTARPSSTCSASPTTPSDRTERSSAASPPTSGPPPPRADPPTDPSPPPPACTAAPCTPPRPTPAATPSPSARAHDGRQRPHRHHRHSTPTSSSTDTSSVSSPSTPTNEPNPSDTNRPTVTERKAPRHA